ncbi:MAG TPA: two-component regulator propeller domain-containing protein [Prolixibacteraceae bacterium]|nr:two-component regulator propeller domain-containing protein [Prolixibacteraceae bacterium]
MKAIYLLFLLLILTCFSTAQSSKRVWNYHLSNIKTFEVVKGNGKIYFLSEGGIYFYKLKDSRVESLSKIDGLSGSDIQSIEYSHTTKSLIVIYKNSMVDIVLDNEKPYQLADIQRKNIVGDKLIYSATCHEELCYLACGFGIVVIDLRKLEIKDSFIIGDNGEYLQVFDVAVDDQNIYAGTPKGIKYAPLNTTNLLDYSNWKYVDNKFVGTDNYNMVKYGANRIWAVHKSEQWHGDHVVSQHAENLWYKAYENIPVIENFNIEGDYIVLSGINQNSQKTVYVDQKDVGPVVEITSYPFEQENLEIYPKSAIIDDEGTIWIADYNYGAIRVKNNTFDRITPEGPVDNGAFSLSYMNNVLWVASGGRTQTWNNIFKPAIIQKYSDNKWEYFDQRTHSELKGISDVIEIVPYPGNPNKILAATWGGGILEFDNGKYIQTYNESNSTLTSIQAGYYNRIGGMAFDTKNGNLWVTNSEVENVLHMKKPTISGTSTKNDWKSFNLPELSYNYKIGKLIVTSKDQVWMMVPRDVTSGLYVMKTDGTQKKQLSVFSYFSNGIEELFPKMNDVYDIVEDKDGHIWVATSKGIAVYNDTEKVFTTDPYYAYQPGVEKNDGIYHPLLFEQTVTAIAVDGGNMKWCGTRNSGLFLISEDGKKEIANYTTENSNLISDVIISLEYDGDNGVLYVGTDLGLVSLLTDSKKPYERFTEVYAYPNPVRSNYDGPIYITGMMENTNVKITTISGRLVYETTSNGGRAVWEGKDLAGNRVHTGVYLALCASEDGKESTVTKIVFIR